MKIYKARLTGILTLLLVPLPLVILPFIAEESLQKHQWIVIGGFFVLMLLLVLAATAWKLEIEDGTVKSYFLGFLVVELSASNVRHLSYGNLLKGGLGMGKGLIIHADVNGKSKRLTLGEKCTAKKLSSM